MDIESADLQPVRQATEEDLTRLFAADLATPLTLVRNYGDRLHAAASGSDRYRLAYYEAVTGHWHEATAPLTAAQVKDAFFDYFQGNWNWHNCFEWRTM